MSWVCIAYKRSSADYCRNCLMASYSSDFDMAVFEHREDVVKWIADIEFRNENLQCGEAGYEIAIIRGEEVCDTEEFDVEEGEEPFPHLTSLYDDARPILNARIKAAKEAEQQKKRVEDQARREEQERRERAKLAELKERYPND
jgi:hypothetical protein